MAPSLRNFLRPAIDPLDIELTRSGNGWIGSIRWRENELAPVHSFKPWEYAILLDGLTGSQAHEFAGALHSKLRLEAALRDTSRMHKIARAVCKEELVGRDFHKASESQSELHCQRKTIWRNSYQLREELREAELMGDLVEFAYDSQRSLPDGSTAVEAHIHRVLVRKVSEDGFRGEHSRGLRDYKLDKVQWLTVQNVGFHRLPTQMLKLSLELSTSRFGGTILTTREGVLGAAGELVQTGEVMSLDDITSQLVRL